MRRREVLIGLGFGAFRTVWGQWTDDPAPWADTRPVPTDVRVLMEDNDNHHLAVPTVLGRDGRTIIAGSLSTRSVLRAWDAGSGRSLYEVKPTGLPIGGMALSADGKRLVFNGPTQFEMLDNGLSKAGWYSGCALRILDADTGQPAAGPDGRALPLLDPEVGAVWMAFAPGGLVRFLDALDRLATWDPVRGQFQLWPENGPDVEDRVLCSGGFAWGSGNRPRSSRDAGRWATLLDRPDRLHRNRRLRLWDVASNQLRDVEMNEVFGRPIDPDEVTISPDGRRLLVRYSEVRTMPNGDQIPSGPTRWALLDFETAKISGHLQDRKDEIGGPHYLAFSPDGKEVVASVFLNPRTEDSVLSVWDLGTGRPTASYRTPGPVRDVAFLPQGRIRVLVGGVSPKGPLAVWDTPTRHP